MNCYETNVDRLKSGLEDTRNAVIFMLQSGSAFWQVAQVVQAAALKEAELNGLVLALVLLDVDVKGGGA